MMDCCKRLILGLMVCAMGGGAVDASQVRINVTDTNAMERVLLDRTNNVTVLNYSTKLTSTSGGGGCPLEI